MGNSVFILHAISKTRGAVVWHAFRTRREAVKYLELFKYNSTITPDIFKKDPRYGCLLAADTVEICERNLD